MSIHSHYLILEFQKWTVKLKKEFKKIPTKWNNFNKLHSRHLMGNYNIYYKESNVSSIDLNCSPPKTSLLLTYCQWNNESHNLCQQRIWHKRQAYWLTNKIHKGISHEKNLGSMCRVEKICLLESIISN